MLSERRLDNRLSLLRDRLKLEDFVCNVLELTPRLGHMSQKDASILQLLLAGRYIDAIDPST